MTVFIARFIPVVRHFISIPAGIGKMPLVPFVLVTFLGSTLWNGFLLAMGMKLREHWTVVQRYSHQVDIVIVALGVIALVWFYRIRMRRRSLPGRAA
jgi:membrane protein DedA with SNARE-associated domain